jgi:cytochrome b561
MTEFAASGPAESRRYTAVAIAFHWVIAVLLVGMVFGGWWMEELSENIASVEDFRFSQFVFNWHKTIGITILLLSLARLGWRLAHPVPPLPSGMKPWEALAARFTHVAFYAIMIGMPIGGYVAASAYGDEFPIALFNAVDLPKLPVPQTESFQELSGSLHGSGGWAILILLAIHAGAALKHHFIDRDDVLARMIPILRRTR